MSTLTKNILAGAILSLSAASANALTVLDAWQLDTNSAGIASTTTNIGELSLSGGIANVEQVVDGSGNPFAGAAFQEFGAIFSIGQVQENCVGACDSGFPAGYNGSLDGLRLRFDALAGAVTAVNVSGTINYAFTPGIGDIFLEGTADNGATWANLAKFGVAPLADGASGGSLNDFNFPAGTNGNSSLTLIGLTAVSNLFKDSLGASLDSFIPNNLFFLIRTNNEISSAPSVSAPCSFDPTKTCEEIQVLSNGSANLAINKVPEPATLGLLGVGLLAFSRNFKRKAQA